MAKETAQEQAERYMRQATELAKLAARASNEEIAATYLDMARVWVKLAEDLRLTPAANDESDEGAGDQRSGAERA